MDKSAEVILPGVNYFQVVVTLRDTNEVGVSATASQLEGRLLLTGGRSRPTMTSRTYHQPTGRASGIKTAPLYNKATRLTCTCGTCTCGTCTRPEQRRCEIEASRLRQRV